jgi:aspartate/methionine/tyrosine aminotransferase
VVATLGSKEGFANMAQAITAPGDVVLVPNPRYPIRILRLDLHSGRRDPWLELTPPSLDGVFPANMAEVSLTPDGRFYTYWYGRVFQDLYVVSGLR